MRCRAAAVALSGLNACNIMNMLSFVALRMSATRDRACGHLALPAPLNQHRGLHRYRNLHLVVNRQYP